MRRQSRRMIRLPKGTRYDFKSGFEKKPFEAPFLQAPISGVEMHYGDDASIQAPREISDLEIDRTGLDVKILLPNAMLGDGEIGIAICPVTIDIIDNKIYNGQRINDQELRNAILFWDRVEIPRTHVISNSNDDVEFLVSEQIVQRSYCYPEHNAHGINMWGFILESMNSLQLNLGEREPGKWSLGRGFNSYPILKNEESFFGTCVQMGNFIPVPSADVPLDDILEFKRNRSPELSKFRYHMNSLYSEIIEADNPDRALKGALGRLSTGIEDYLKVSREWKVPMVFSGWKIRISTGSVKDGFTAGLLANAVQFSPLAQVACGVIGAIAASVSIEFAPRVLGDDGQPFEYIFKYDRELVKF